MKRYILLLLLFLLTGCGAKRESKEEMISKIDEKIANELENVIEVQDGESKYVGFSTYYSNDFILGEKTLNNKYGFFQREYIKEGAQFGYKSEIYSVNLENQEVNLLYENKVSMLNELVANDDYLFWVEYYSENDELMFRIVQFDLETAKAQYIATGDTMDKAEPCLSISNQYLTWFDSDHEGNATLVCYDIAKGKIRQSERVNCKLFNLYTRPNIVDNAVTLFNTDNNDLRVCRYSLDKKETIFEIVIAPDDVVACFSNEEWVGWQKTIKNLPYANSTFYFYNIKENILYRYNEKGEKSIFSYKMNNDYFVYFSNEENKVHVIDLKQMTDVVMDVGDTTRSAWIILTHDNKIAIEMAESNKSSVGKIE